MDETLGDCPLCGLPMARTLQWAQRLPHKVVWIWGQYQCATGEHWVALVEDKRDGEEA